VSKPDTRLVKLEDGYSEKRSNENIKGIVEARSNYEAVAKSRESPNDSLDGSEALKFA